MESGFSRVELSHNTREIIRQELLDTTTVRLLAKWREISDQDFATLHIAEEAASDAPQVSLYQIGRSTAAFGLLSEQLRDYVRAREEGHTREFLLAAVTNRMALSSISDPDLRAIAATRPLLPIPALKKAGSWTTTNQAGRVAGRSTTITITGGKTVTNETTHIPKRDEVWRWVAYTVVDGEIAWRYTARFQPDGSLSFIDGTKSDAKDDDPKYQEIMAEVEKEVAAEMKKSGRQDRFGSIHTFWHLKKEKLKARGIEWRSPSELNPDTRFD